MKKYSKIIVALLAVIIILTSTLLYGVTAKSKVKISANGIALAAASTTVLSGIVMSSSTDTVSNAYFASFAMDLSEVQTLINTVAITATGRMAMNGKVTSYAQVYNIIARGVKSIDDDSIVNEDWLPQEEAEKVLCTKINPEKISDVIGFSLPTLKVENKKGELISADYYITKTGEVFIWPPYEHEKEYYANASVVVVDKTGNPINSKNASEMFKDDFVLQIDGLEIPVGEYLK